MSDLNADLADLWRNKYYDVVEELNTAMEERNELIEALKMVELHNPAPDLSSFKYQDAYRLIMPTVKKVLEKYDSK